MTINMISSGMRNPFLVLILCVIAFSLSSCDKAVIEPNSSETYFSICLVAANARCAMDTCAIGVLVSVASDPIISKDEMHLTINNVHIDSMSDFPYLNYHYPTFLAWSKQPSLGNQLVTIKTSNCQVTGSISFPDSVTIISPRNGDTIQIDKEFKINWQGNADHFLIHCLTDERDTITSAHEAIMPANWIPKTTNVSVEISVTPINGPMNTGGTQGNLIGSGNGFLSAQNQKKSIKIFTK